MPSIPEGTNQLNMCSLETVRNVIIKPKDKVSLVIVCAGQITWKKFKNNLVTLISGGKLSE